MKNGAAQGQPLLPTGWKQARHGVAPVFQASHLENIFFPGGAQFLRHGVDPAEEIDVF